MTKKDLIKSISKEFNVTPEEVETEMKKAIAAAGYDMEISEFIKYVSNLSKRRFNNKK